MGSRSALLVGSLPYRDEREAMSIALDKLGPMLRSVPDGEIGERTPECPNGSRSSWVVTLMDRCERDLANWEVIRPTRRNAAGVPDDYDGFCQLKPRHPPATMADHLDFGWLDFALASYPTFLQLRRQAELDRLHFQVGLPSALGATGMLSMDDRRRYLTAFTTRLAFEANEIAKAVDSDLVLQLEVPAEVGLAYGTPPSRWGFALDAITDLLALIETPTPFGVHLCFSDLNHKAAVQATTLEPLVELTNALLARWPSTHPLDYLHVPLAEGAQPPPVDPEWYAPLAEIDLPTSARFVAGFVHERRSPDELHHLRDILDGTREQPVDIAASCGLGRRDRHSADLLLDLTAQLTSDA